MSSSPARKVQPQNLLFNIAACTDKNIAQLNRVTTTTSGLDASLSTISFLSLLISSLISPSISPKATTVAGPKLSSTPTRLSLLKLYTIISTARTFLRLTSPPAIWTGASSTLRTPSPDTYLLLLAYLQQLTYISYQVLESSAYLAAEKIIVGKGWGTKSQNKWYMWSSRFWAGYILLDLLRLAREKRLENGSSSLLLPLQKLEKEAEMTDSKELAGQNQDPATNYEPSPSSSSSSSSRAWWEPIAINLAWAPLAVHWGLEDGLVDQKVVGLLGTLASGLTLKKAWREKAA